MLPRLISMATAALLANGFCAQSDTLWMVPGGVGLGGDTLAALRFCDTPQFQVSNETIDGALSSLVLVNGDSVAHELACTALEGTTWSVAPGASVELDVSGLGNATHRLWSVTERGQTLGLSTMVRSGWDDLPHYEWNLNEWDPEETWVLAEGGSLDPSAAYVPRQFTINDLNFPNTLADSSSYVQTSVGAAVYISIVNQGRMDQVLHFHGYHVDMLQSSAHGNRVGWSKDTVPVKAGERVVVRLDPNQSGEYPVHAHNLVAVTNAGFYPGGMITYLNVAP
ncbi:MAG: multicopper oxidase domain-containing protein [Bacteroidetes bacterium]|nr:multicopper oxidase domain-containing protein [Bacteroidota bacterium]MDA0904020.1 multicopper oxidase domain-containing protein [Bacteroidota bacterium]MDA1242990.1 multicopper oxidase domain-containing protein [Bacteroidota bacterium]